MLTLPRAVHVCAIAALSVAFSGCDDAPSRNSGRDATRPIPDTARSTLMPGPPLAADIHRALGFGGAPANGGTWTEEEATNRYLIADAIKVTDPVKADALFRVVIENAPQGSPMRASAARALEALRDPARFR